MIGFNNKPANPGAWQGALALHVLAVAALLAALVVAASFAGAAGPASQPALSIFEASASAPIATDIDRIVSARQARLGIPRANLCSDAVFVRRVYLDVIGTLPTAKEARDFLNDRSPSKRQVLIDRLLARDEFADYWSLKWSDLLRVKAEFPINLWPKAVEMYHRWIWESLRANKPYDRFAREMLTASGSNFVVPEVNFYRALQGREPAAIAQAVALSFMGASADKWPKDRLDGMAGFFSLLGYKSTLEWKEEIVFFDPALAKGKTPVAVFPDGKPAKLSLDQDPRIAFADWLVSPRNPWFARAAVNRVWCWLMGRGIIHEPDDIRPDNPPENPELLAYLERQLIDSHYDLKHIYRLILNSQTYQLSSVARGDPASAAAHFACYPLRRLEAEVLIDALDQITGTTEEYVSATPEPFSFIPADQRSILLADGSTTSSFLELFGRPPRDTGLDSERNNKATAAQQLHLLNSTHIQRKIEQGKKLQPLLWNKNPREAVASLYLTILSRFPTEDEFAAASAYAKTAGLKGREANIDLAWALINSEEFLYRH